MSEMHGQNCVTWKSFQAMAAIAIVVMFGTFIRFRVPPRSLVQNSISHVPLNDNPCPPLPTNVSSKPRFNKQAHERQVSLADGQYSFQRTHEHKWQQTNPMLDRFEAEWPCFFGEEAVGTHAGDGLKWVCGLRKIESPCVVYSVGSNSNFDFEFGINDIAPHCKTFVFDHTVNPPNPLPRGVEKFVHRGLTGKHDEKTPQLMTLREIMKMLNHTHVDVFKIDCEGCEKSLVAELSKEGWPSMGQFLVEYHDHEAKTDDKDFFRFMKGIEGAGFRLFHKEANVLGGAGHCTELAFIQAKWEPGKKTYASPKQKS